MITDPKGNITEVNEAFCRISGFSRNEILGENPRKLKSGRHEAPFYRNLWHSIIKQGHWQGEVWNRDSYGALYAARVTISAIHDDKGQISSYIALYTDVTTEKEQQRQLQHITHYDALTNLPNRILLGDRLSQAMAQSQHRGQLLALAYLDLDGFKEINDRHGHEVGDELLVMVAQRLGRTLRGGDTIARIGGDEFVAVFNDLATREQGEELVSGLLELASQPLLVNDLELQLSSSIGLTFYPQQEEVDGDQLIRQGDQAMYQAKLAGKNRIAIFDTEGDRDVRGLYENLQRVEQALAAREFVLYYQPKVNMRSGEVIGVEALIRWQHPQQGLLPPAAFLPLVERHPLSVDIGRWVIESAMDQIKEWRKEGRPLPISVNVGALQLQDEHFVDHLKQALARFPEVAAGDLELEVLETSALENITHIAKVIRKCRSMGITFALDDFGTGYSSLTYLKRLPVTQLKIDQSFVRDMLDDAEDLAILNGVMGLASAFRLQYIAEGVETLEHGCMLLMLGYELAQGYGIAKPMPAEALEKWLREWRLPPAWGDCNRLNQGDLPLLYASVEHAAWIRHLSEYIDGARAALPQLEPGLCRFGQWLEGIGHEHYGGREEYAQIVELHNRTHQTAKQLLGILGKDGAKTATDRLGELHEIKEQMRELLQRMLRSR
jgi:diguanylate cyclase (GGDEF)-like protein/PAS domain S-box-containing protein